MNRNVAAAWIYAGSAVAGPVVFWLFGRRGSVRLDSYFIWCGIGLLSVVALAMSFTRPRFWAAPAMELGVAILWFSTLLSVAFLHGLDPKDSRDIGDAIAALVVITGLTMLVMTGQVLVGNRFSTGVPPLGRVVHVIGLGGLSVHLIRFGVQLYMTTRVRESQGIASITAECNLRRMVTAVCAVALVAGVLLTRPGRPPSETSVSF